MTIRKVLTAKAHGSFSGGQPMYGAAHDLEAPVRAGLAYDLAIGYVPNEGVGPHFLSDPRESIQVLETSQIGYHLGNGNQRCIGFEVTGYARFSRAEWLAETSLNALRNQAECMAMCALRYGWELRWLSLTEIASGRVKGFITHNDARQVWGGTTHTDPGPGYPYDVVMKMVQQWAGQEVTAPTTPNKPSTGTGGAEPKKEDDMPRRILVVFDGNMKATGQVFDGPTGVVPLFTNEEVDCVKAVIDDNEVVNQREIDVYNGVLARGVGSPAPKS